MKMQKATSMLLFLAVFVSVVPAFARVCEGASFVSIPGLSETALPDTSQLFTDSRKPDSMLLHEGNVVAIVRHYFFDAGEEYLGVVKAVRMPWNFDHPESVVLWFWKIPQGDDSWKIFAAFVDPAVIFSDVTSIGSYGVGVKENAEITAIKVVIYGIEKKVLAEHLFKTP